MIEFLPSHCVEYIVLQPDVSLAVVSVQAGKRYRFRLISMSCEPNYMFSIDGHNFTVIEVAFFVFCFSIAHI